MGKANATLDPATAADVDAAELDKFRAVAARWWDADGPLRPLHRLNPVRLDYIIGACCRWLGRTREGRRPLAGLRVLDVGCGGGLLAEPLARLGASVTGIDPEADSIATAQWHAREAGLTIDYRATTLAQLQDVRAQLQPAAASFDAVLAMEVIEHVPDPDELTRQLAQAVRPGGLVVMATLSRTWASYALGIVAAERVLGWLPPGTHDWRKFLKPSELARSLRQAGLRPVDVTGVRFNPAYDRFETTRNVDVNYMVAAVKG